LDCNYLKECGSCTLFTPYDEQILFKTDLVKQNFSEFYDGKFDVFSSSLKHYRTRAEFGVWHESSELSYTMHASEKGKRIFIDECPKVCEQISDLMPRLLENLQSDEILRTKLFGVEFISCKSGVLVTLLYHKKLDSEFESAMKILASKLDITILAISRGQKLLSGELNFSYEIRELSSDEPVKLSDHAINLLSEEAAKLGIKTLTLPSGAGHDAMNLTKLASSVGMLFIPCVGGISHNIAEAINFKDAVAATRILTNALIRLSNEE